MLLGYTCRLQCLILLLTLGFQPLASLAQQKSQQSDPVPAIFGTAQDPSGWLASVPGKARLAYAQQSAGRQRDRSDTIRLRFEKVTMISNLYLNIHLTIMSERIQDEKKMANALGKVWRPNGTA